MRITLLFCAALLAAPFGTGHAQAVWKWKDEKGVTHYSDQPGPGAVRVDLSSQTYSSDEARTDIQVDNAPRSRDEPAQSYNALQITSPQANQTMFASEGAVSVQVNVDPGLQPGHSIQILFDGVNSARMFTSLSATCRNGSRDAQSASQSGGQQRRNRSGQHDGDVSYASTRHQSQLTFGLSALRQIHSLYRRTPVSIGIRMDSGLHRNDVNPVLSFFSARSAQRC